MSDSFTNYKVLERIGKGHFCDVYKVEKDGTLYVSKEFNYLMMTGLEKRAMLREVGILKRIN